MTYKLRFTNGGEPSDDERRDLTIAYNDWQAAREGASGDEEAATASDLIDQLLAFASIETDEADTCEECGEELDYDAVGFQACAGGLCGRCIHDIRRSGGDA